MATDALRTVLIVDDDVSLAKLMQRRLNSYGFTASIAISGTEAFAQVTSQRPELLLLDFTLPDMNGLELLEKLSQQGCEVPFVVVTGREDHQLAVRLMKRGARDYIVKDTSLGEMLPSVVTQVFEQMDRDRRLAEAESHIREQKQALRESQARLRQVLESLSIVLVSSDASTKRISLIVGAVQDILGYPAQAFLENPQLLHQLIDPQDAPLFERALRDSIAEQRGFEIDFRIRHGADDHIAWIRVQAVPIFADDGQLLRVDSILVDATREKQIAEQREQLEHQLEQTHRLESLGVLAGGIAHDFGNLLTIISGNLQFLRETLHLGPAEAKALTDMETAARNASDMTRSLQAFSRPSKPEIRTVDVNALIKEVYRFLSRLIPVRIGFQFVPAEVPCPVSADPAQLQQVLINLCINARDAISAQGQLQIRTRRITRSQLPRQVSHEADAPEYIEVCVSDTGCGMDRQTLRRIFDPFFTTKPKDQGTGLGLAIVYKIVRAHNGLVHVTSTPGQGTRFRFFLPQTVSEPAVTPTAPRVVRGTEQILVVDDDEMIASLIKTVLESSGYSVAVAHHPDQAIALCEASSEPMALSVVDYGLPGMNGPKCIARLRERWPELKAILITGYQMNMAELNLDNVQVLQKPFSPHVIIEAVRNALDERA